MTISTTTRTKQYNGDNSTTVFAYDFDIQANGELEVYLGTPVGAPTTWTLQTITTHYTVSGAGDAGGGNVTMLSAPPTGAGNLYIRRVTAKSQGTNYVENDPTPSDSFESALDKLTQVTQDMQEEIDRCFKLSGIVPDAGVTGNQLSAAQRASLILAFDTSGDLAITQELGVFKGNWAASTAYVMRDLIKDTSNNNIYICTTAHTSSGAQPISGNADVAKWSLIVDAAAATTSAAVAAADLVLTNADVVLTHADVVLTHADVVLTNADELLTRADTVLTAADVVLTGNDVTSTNADVVSTGNDVTSTNADVVLTNADVVTTGEIAGAVALPYIFNTTTTMADPAGTFFRLNSATPASVTAIAFGDTTSDGVDLSSWLADWADSTSTLTGTIRIVQQGTPAKTIVFNVTAVTDSTDWLQVTVQHVSGTSIFTSAATCRVTFARTGDKGDTGSTGSTGATGSTGSTGATGPTGVSAGLPFTFNSATTDADKDAGDFWYDAVVGSASIVYLDDADKNGNAVSSITDTWDDNGSATHRGLLIVKQDANPANMASFKVTGSITDATGYSKLSVTLLGAFGTISNNDACHIEFVPTGTGGIANRTVDTMTGDASDTTLLLSQAPGSENNVTVTFDGVTQHHDTYSLSGSTITFSTAPPSGVAVEAVSGGLESIGVPSDATVTTIKIAANAVDETKLKDALVADFTEVVVAAGDSFLLGDSSDSGNTKRDTIQGILDLVPAAGADTSLSNLSATGENLVAQAWVRFNGTGTVAINDSYNVSSITDNVTGDYTVNFASALANANYAMATSCLNASAPNTVVENHGAPTRTTGAIRLYCLVSGAPTDFTGVSCIFFGD